MSLEADLAWPFARRGHHALSEGVCNHFQCGAAGRTMFLLNPRGLHTGAGCRPMTLTCNAAGEQLGGRHPVEPTAMFITTRQCTGLRKAVVMHNPHAMPPSLSPRPGRWTPRRSRRPCASMPGWRVDPHLATALALDVRAKVSALPRPAGADVVFSGQPRGDRLRSAHRPCLHDDLYYPERACQVQLRRRPPAGIPLAPVEPPLAARVAARHL